VGVKHHTLNSVRIEGDTAYLQLTNRRGEPTMETMIDIADLPAVQAAGRWRSQWDRHTRSYYVRQSRHFVLLHRFLLDAPEGMVVDHRNHDTLDNRRANIWVCTHRDNLLNCRPYRRRGLVAEDHLKDRMAQMNRARPTRAASGVRNVYWCKDHAKWRVTAFVDGRKVHVGYFTSIEEAQAASERCAA
jgi:hypothetical protein